MREATVGLNLDVSIIAMIHPDTVEDYNEVCCRLDALGYKYSFEESTAMISPGKKLAWRRYLIPNPTRDKYRNDEILVFNR